MKYLETGRFFGETNKLVQLEGLTLTSTDYVNKKVEWHYHENAHFAFILNGKILEETKNDSYNCTPGTLVFHSREEPHCNVKSNQITDAFHLEIHQSWFDNIMFNACQLEGIRNIKNPDVKILFHKLYREAKIGGPLSMLSIQDLLVQLCYKLARQEGKTYNKPKWVDDLKEIIYSTDLNKVTLDYLSQELNLHPVHISRTFSKYTGCNLGYYIRKLKVESALAQFQDRKLTLAQIALKSGFADQSHFLRCFKEVIGLKPSVFRELINSAPVEPHSM